jgi:predicted protein tyrosine phosphatase
MNHPQKLLFVCSKNRLRSLTAEHMLQGTSGYAVKSAGTEPNARIRVNEGHLGWADLIFVMEKRHRHILEENFPEAVNAKRIICLNIPDVYRYMEPALIDELKTALSEHIQLNDEVR